MHPLLDVNYLKKPARVLRGNLKIKFKLMLRCTRKYLKSPLYRDSILWDTIPQDIQRSVSINAFTKHVSLTNCEYVDLILIR